MTTHPQNPMPDEQWMPVAGFESYYQVSNLGRIRTIKTGRIRILGHNEQGYNTVSLCMDGRCRTKIVHRIVAKAFLSKEHPLANGDVNHINGIKTDNRVENLEWTNDKLNSDHAFSLGLIVRPKGEDCSAAKLTNSQVVAIRKRLENGCPNLTIAKEYNVSTGLICSIKKRRIWKHI